MVRRTLLIALLASLSGCSTWFQSEYEDPSYDINEAQKALMTALGAWKQGKTASLLKQQPAIKFTDDDLRMGLQLISYEIVDPASIGPFKDVAVKLELRTRDGRSVSRAATYQVSLMPAISVSRSDT
jgi:hypothetical protein